MADDITIKSVPPGGQGDGSKQVTPVTNQGSQPVIDLRSAAAGNPPAPPTPPAPQKPAKPAGFNLEDEAMMEASQSVAAPPDKYAVPSLVKDKFPDLVQLIKDTESMNDDERDYWFQILPIMTEEQIKKFRDILVNEKDQLSRLDKEYEQELTKLNEKHLIEWKEFESKEKRKALQSAEQASQEEETKAEEELLKRLSS